MTRRHEHTKRNNQRQHRIAKTLASIGIAAFITGVILMLITFGPRLFGQQWYDGETHGHWTARYTGYGNITAKGERITIAPKAATEPDVTHGGLVHTTNQCHNPTFTVTVHTETQLRHGEPNPWEVGWVLWNYQTDTNFYALALKPNGWEISKQDPDYEGNQRFLASDDTPEFPIGQDYRVHITHQDDTMTVAVNGYELATFTDTQHPYTHGAVGLYTEDAKVHYTDFQLEHCAEPH